VFSVTVTGVQTCALPISGELTDDNLERTKVRTLKELYLLPSGDMYAVA
jgi:hypothetical protein